MPTFESKYSDAQREAVAVAYLDRRIKPAQAVADLAARGELAHGDGVLEPFDIPAQSVRDYAAKLRKARAGQLKSGLTDAPPRDAVEALRRRLVSAADHMLAKVESRQRRNREDPKDPELLRQIARAVREVAAIPGPNDPRPNALGPKEAGKANAGLAGSILNAHRKEGVHTPDEDPRQGASTDTENGGERSAARDAAEPQEGPTDDAPGAWMREQTGALVP